MAIRVGINGFGRIGRNCLRALTESKLKEQLVISHINDLAPIETLAHLLQYDSVHGTFKGSVAIEKNQLNINNHIISVSQEKDPSQCPWGQHNVDVVFECTGRFTQRDQATLHLKGGAKKVIISAPGKDVDATIVYGVNHTQLTHAMEVISNASCTTNCLAPLVKPLHEEFGITNGLMTTIHAATGDQQVVDTAHPDLRRARAALCSMIPTKTGAAAAIGLVMPELKGKLDGFAIRVPTTNVSVVDFTFEAQKHATVESINTCLMKAAESTELKAVLAINHRPLVSIDFNHHPASSIADLSQTKVNGNLVKVLAWYDNEWGFSNRMLDTAAYWLNQR